MAFTNEEKMFPADDLAFGVGESDDTLVTTIDFWIKESESYHSILLEKQSRSLSYYHGAQTDHLNVPGFNSNTVHNRIFEGTETLVPIVSGTAHQFMAIPGNENEVSLTTANKVQNVLQIKYDDLDVQGKVEDIVRDMILKRFGVLEWFWDFDIDDLGVRVVDPRLILIPPLRVTPEELPYIIRIQEFTDSELKENFPNVDPKKLLSVDRKIETRGSTKTQEDTDVQTKQVFETWTNEFVAWKLGDQILDKKPNPYWDFKGEEKGKKKEKTRVFFNHLARPTMPFVFFAPFRTGGRPVAETSLCEIGMPIQDDINVQKRQIINNLVKMGNGQVLVDKGVMTDEELDQITSEPGLKIVGDGVASENRIRRDPGIPLPNAHFSNLIDSNQAFDRIFGVTAAISGTSESSTLGGQILNRQQSLSRIDLLTREVNRGMGQLVNGLAQMMKMFYTEKRVFKRVGTDDAVEFFRFLRDDIEDNLVVRVKSGNIFPQDARARADRAIQLFQLGALDPTTLYRMMDFPNPEETAERLLAWLTGQLAQKTEAEIVKGQAIPPETPGEEGGTKDEKREVETQANSAQRAEQSLSGGPAQLPKTPKTKTSK